MRVRTICRELRRMETAGRPLAEILERAVELLHDANRRFHWTGIYELFPDNVLRLGPFVGAPADHEFVAVGQGVCGAAVAERRNLNVPDVSHNSSYTAVSAATRSELVVLIRKGERVYAQIDIDSHELDAFDDEAVRGVEQLADWLADRYAQREHAALRHPSTAVSGSGRRSG